MSRGRAMLLSQRTSARWGLKPLGAPPEHLAPAVLAAWHDIARAAGVPLTSLDCFWLEMCARLLAHWRTGGGDRVYLREAYRWLGQGFVPMSERRRLLFPDRPKRKALP